MAVKNVFICYRRDDAEGYAGRLYDRLNARFPGRIFIDVTGISPGADFARVIQEKVGACSALLAIIGKQWLTMADEASHRRIFRKDDYVRHEIATALLRNIAVIPVLVRDAQMPKADSLPPDLAALSFRNAIEISDTDFDHDVGLLIRGLELVFGEQTPVAPPPAKSSNSTCLILAVIALLLGGAAVVIFIIMAIAANQAANNQPTPVHTQTPHPAPTQAPEPDVVDFDPVGSWTLLVENRPARRIEFYEDHTYRSLNEQGRWQLSPTNKGLTLQGQFYDVNNGTTLAIDVQIVIDGRNGDQLVGHANSNAGVSRIWLTPL